MHEIKISRMSFENFKSFSSFEVDFGEKTTDVSGTNGTGKTTIKNGWLWCLTGKDVEGKADFEIKPKTGLGEKVACSVTILLSLNGSERSIERIYKEKWRKPNGSLNKVHDGHTTEYKVDGLKTTKKEFELFVDENFKKVSILSSPLGFSELPWKELREILLSVSGGNNNLSQPEKVTEICGDRKYSEIIPILKSQRLEQEKDRESILSKIEERQEDLKAELPENSLEDIETIVSELKEENISSNQKLVNLKSPDQAIIDLESEKNGLVSEKTELMNIFYNNKNDSVRGINKKIADVNVVIAGLTKKSTDSISDLKGCVESRDSELGDLELLKNKYREINSQELSGKCDKCNQDLPIEEVERLTDEFKLNKANSLEKNIEDGKSCKNRIAGLSADIENLNKSIEKIAKDIDSKNKELQSLQTKLDEETNRKQPEKITLIESEIAKIEKSIEKANSNDYDDETNRKIQDIEENISITTSKVEGYLKEKEQIENRNKSVVRIEELRTDSIKIEEHFNLLSGKIFVLEQYEKEVLNSISESINSNFKTVQFKLFKEQLNEGHRPICDPVISGVPFYAANYGARVQAGIEITQVLQKYYGVVLPVFIDNRESVVEIPETAGQVINFYVKKSFKKLDVKGE